MMRAHLNWWHDERMYCHRGWFRPIPWQVFNPCRVISYRVCQVDYPWCITQTYSYKTVYINGTLNTDVVWVVVMVRQDAGHRSPDHSRTARLKCRFTSPYWFVVIGFPCWPNAMNDCGSFPYRTFSNLGYVDYGWSPDGHRCVTEMFCTIVLNYRSGSRREVTIPILG